MGQPRRASLPAEVAGHYARQLGAVERLGHARPCAELGWQGRRISISGQEDEGDFTRTEFLRHRKAVFAREIDIQQRPVQGLVAGQIQGSLHA